MSVVVFSAVLTQIFEKTTSPEGFQMLFQGIFRDLLGPRQRFSDRTVEICITGTV